MIVYMMVVKEQKVYLIVFMFVNFQYIENERKMVKLIIIKEIYSYFFFFVFILYIYCWNFYMKL